MNIVKIVSITGTALSIVGTVLSGWAGSKEMSAKVSKEVAKQLAEKVVKN